MSYPFLTIFLAGLFLGAVYMTLHREQLLFMTMLLAGLGTLCFAIAQLSRKRVIVKRTVHDRVQAGDTVQVTLTVENSGTLPRFGVTLVDEVGPWLARQGQTIRYLPVLWPKRQVVVEYELEAERRGVHPVGPLRMRLGDPLEMFQRVARVGEATEAVIYPEVVTLPAPLGGQTPFAPGMSEQRSALGAGTDFYGIREYQPGDELRRIHWKATARRNRLAVVEFEENLTGNLTVLLDAETGNDFGEGKDTSFELAIKVAAALINDSLQQGTIVRLMTHCNNHLIDVEAGADESLDVFLETLARVEANGEVPAVSLAMELATEGIPGETVVIITAKPHDAWVDATVAMQRAGLDPVVVLMDAGSFDLKAPHEDAAVTADALSQVGTRTYLVRQGASVAAALLEMRDGYSRN